MSSRPKMSVSGRLFQARMWREYAMTFDGRKAPGGIDAAWVTSCLKMTREECIRRSRINQRLAHRLLKRGER